MIRIFKNKRQTKIFEDLFELEEKEKKGKISISESFQKYVKQTLPKYETEIETNILRNLYSKINDPALRQHLVYVYKRRQLHLAYKAIQPDLTVLPIQPATPPEPPLPDYLGKSIEKVGFAEIGKMYRYSLDEFIYYFPRMNYGHLDFVDRQMKYSRSFAFQMSPEAFSVIELLRKKHFLSKLPFENFKMEKLFQNAKSKKDLEVLFSDQEVFLKFIFTICSDFREILLRHRFEEYFENLFGNSFLIDHIALLLAWNLDQPEIRKLVLNSENRKTTLEYIFHEIVNHKNCKYFIPYQIISWLENHGTLNLNAEISIDLMKNQNCVNQLPEKLRNYMLPNFISLNSNVLFWGRGGAGKSGLLYAVTMWAIKSGHLVFKMPSVKALTINRNMNLIFHEKSRLFFCFEVELAILHDIVNTNIDILKSIPVDLDLFGYYNIIGIHDKEANPVPNFYIEDRQTYFYEADKFRTEEEVIALTRDQEDLNGRVKDVCPKPKTLYDIAMVGIKESKYALNCIAELLEQAYNQNSHLLLVTVDDYNWFFRPTNNPCYAYWNIKSLEGFVPPYHIGLARLFMKFDGHLMKNGFKVAGTSNYTIEKHYFEPKKINFPEPFCHRLEGIQLPYMENFMSHFFETKFDVESERNWDTYKTLWSEAQGNYGRIVRLIKYPDFRFLDS